MNINTAIEEFLASRLVAGCRPSTVKSYTRTLSTLAKHLGSDIEMKAITPMTLRGYLAELAETLKPSSINNSRRVLLTFLRFCEVEDILPAQNWSARIPRVKTDQTEPRHLSEEECERLVSAVDIYRRGQRLLASRDKALLYMLLDTGLRRVECISLKLTDIDMVTRTVRVTISKSRKSRVTFYGEKTEKALKTYLKQRRAYLGDREREYLWITRTRSRLSHQELYDIIQELARISQIPRLGVHSLRHTCATLLLKNGYPLSYVQAVLGHSTPVITQKYTHLASTDLSDRYSLASPVDNL
jgi:site-specific recombinase XerD